MHTANRKRFIVRSDGILTALVERQQRYTNWRLENVTAAEAMREFLNGCHVRLGRTTTLRLSLRRT